MSDRASAQRTTAHVLARLLPCCAAVIVLAIPAMSRATEIEPRLCAADPATALPETCSEEAGTLVLALLDAASGLPSPARIEVLDESGQTWIASDAIPVGGDCGGHVTAPASAGAPGMRQRDERAVRNPQSETFQLYLAGEAALALPPGRYRVSAHKGPEYDVATLEVTIAPGSETRTVLQLARWIDMRALGWFGADDHLHVTRRGPEDDPRLARWMQAEDLAVANLLQMEIVPGVLAATQYGFGARSLYQDGDTIVASGQENPRTWILGHGIILGASSYIDFPGDPLAYPRYWAAAREQQALRGYAHWGTGAARDGLAIDASARNVEFLEVLQSDLLNPEALYQVLGLGIRMAPTAGTDYPCTLTNLPGRDRFYTRVAGELTYARWLEAIRHGRTFVTNGPLLTEFRVGDAEVGDEVGLDAAGSLPVRGTVRFDPARDDVDTLELVRDGEVVAVARPGNAAGEIQLATTLDFRDGAWLALRAEGRKLDVPPFARPRRSSMHSAPIWVAVASGAEIAGQDAARRLANEELARLDRLEKRLERDARLGPPAWAGATREEVERALPLLREAIAAARMKLESIARPVPADPGR